MEARHGRDFVESLLRRNRYLVLATMDESGPWAVPLEYMVDDDLNLYFFSTEEARHVRDLETRDRVAVAVFDSDQPDYAPDLTADLNGVQMVARVRRVPEDEYTEAIVAAIDALKPPMPPYAVFRIEPERCFVPRIEDGVNVRREVSL